MPFKNRWKASVSWSREHPVVASAVGTFLGSLPLLLLEDFRVWVLSLIEVLGVLATTEVSLRTWQLLLIAIGCCLVIPAWQVIQRRREPEDPKSRYVSDQFLELPWEWRWNSLGEPDDFSAICPECSCEMKLRTMSNNNEAVAICDLCGEIANLEVGIYELKDVLARRVKRKVRLEDYPPS